MASLFGLRTVWGAGSQAIRGAFGMAKGSVDNAVNGAAKKNLEVLKRNWRADPSNAGKTLTDDIVKTDLIPVAEELAENSGAGWIKKGFGVLGLGAGAGILGLGADAAIRAENSVASNAVEGIMNAGKDADALSDMQAMWKRIIAFFTEGFEQLRVAMGGKPSTPPASENDGNILTDNIITDNPGTSLAVGAGLGVGALALKRAFSGSGTSPDLGDGPSLTAGGSRLNRAWGAVVGRTKLGKIATLAGVGTVALGVREASAAGSDTQSLADATADLIPGVDVVKNLIDGDTNAAIENSAGLAGGLTAAFAAAAPAAAAGAAVGTAIPVPILGTAVGAVVGGAVGLTAYIAGDSIGRGLAGLFNRNASDTSPAQVQQLQASPAGYAPAILQY